MSHKQTIWQFYGLAIKKITLYSIANKEKTNDFVDYFIKVLKGTG